MTRFRTTGWLLTALALTALGLGCSRDRPDETATPPAGALDSGAESVPAPATAEEEAPVGAIAAADLAGRLGTADEPVILDVRSPDEYSDGHIPGAINVPYDQIGTHLDSLEAYRDREIVVYCRSGRRAGVAEAALADAGFRHLLDLEGHMQSWQAAQYPLAVPAADCC